MVVLEFNDLIYNNGNAIKSFNPNTFVVARMSLGDISITFQRKTEMPHDTYVYQVQNLEKGTISEYPSNLNKGIPGVSVMLHQFCHLMEEASEDKLFVRYFLVGKSGLSEAIEEMTLSIIEATCGGVTPHFQKMQVGVDFFEPLVYFSEDEDGYTENQRQFLARLLENQVKETTEPIF